MPRTPHSRSPSAATMVEDLPDDLPGRLSLVGCLLFGPDWQKPLAQALGVHRVTLFRWLDGKRPLHNVDVEMLRVLDGVAEHRRRQIKEMASLEVLFEKRIKNAR